MGSFGCLSLTPRIASCHSLCHFQSPSMYLISTLVRVGVRMRARVSVRVGVRARVRVRVRMRARVRVRVRVRVRMRARARVRMRARARVRVGAPPACSPPRRAARGRRR